MKHWMAVLFALMIVVGCGGGGGGGGGGSVPDDTDDPVCEALTLPDDFERDVDGVLSAHCSEKWMAPERYERGDNSYSEFRTEDGSAYATGAINVNLWDEVFPSDQAVRFIIKEVPEDSGTSSLGVLLRINLDNGTGYLVTFVPIVGENNDELRIWLVEDYDIFEEGTAIETVDTGIDFEVGDLIHVQISTNQVYVDISDNDGIKYFTNPVINDDALGTYNQEGYIGIYGAGDSGAIELFDKAGLKM